MSDFKRMNVRAVFTKTRFATEAKVNYYSSMSWLKEPLICVYYWILFLILGRSVGKRKQKRKTKIGKEIWSYEARYLSIISVEPENNKVRLLSRHVGNEGEGIMGFVVRLKREQGKKLKVCKAYVSDESKNCLNHVSLHAKIWVGGTTQNRDKKGHGLSEKKTFPNKKSQTEKVQHKPDAFHPLDVRKL